ncbi:hypothetical protein EDC96DRAFT_440524 [Choanephora cucurbitarum]|nr:hypothetical protein EDC96DRAFT_440524 [Choanephora cucurbitarum]
MSLSNSPPNSRKVSSKNTTNISCEQCRRQNRICNSQRPCSQCFEANQHCVYSVISDQSRSVFSTLTARRVSSGSACETCRRRKTKCDDGYPCNFCATNNLKCVNHSERRLLAKQQQQQQQQQQQHMRTQQKPIETMDRIEDRLSRIERLMTVFTPSPLSSSATTSSHKMVRPHRHSVQGINVAKEQAEMNMMKRRGSPYSFSNPRYGSLSPSSTHTATDIINDTERANLQSSNTVNIANSMHNLTLSPTISSNTNSPYPLTSTSSPISGLWPLSPPVSSDQLSKRTFAPSIIDHTTNQFPIYPLTPPVSRSNADLPVTLSPRPNSHS